MITLRGQILVSRTGDATLRVLCCAFVRCVCCWCAMCVCVCWCVCWCWCWCVTLTSPPSSLPLAVCTFHTPLRVYIRNVSVCTGTTPASVTTCGHGAETHGDVLNVHTFFSVPHHTHTHTATTTTFTTQHGNNTPHHTETGTERDRERQ